MKIQKIMSTNLSKTARNTAIGSMVALSTLVAGTTLQAKNMTSTKPVIEQNNSKTEAKNDKIDLLKILGSVVGCLAFCAAMPDSEIGKKHWGFRWYFENNKNNQD